MRYEILANGVEVVVEGRPAAPAVAVQCWIGVGSLHERSDERGMSHFLEHMLFKGTGRRQAGEIAATVEACGGEINAYTTFDRTVFYLTLASPFSRLGVELLADAVFNSTLPTEEFAREKEVILEEIHRANDDPAIMVGRQVFAVCYRGTEAARPISGNESEVKSISRERLHDFYQRWYQPANLAVVAVGDFIEEEMLALLVEQFGGRTSRPLPKRRSVRVRFPAGLSTFLLKGDYQQPRLEVVYPAPALGHPDGAALDLAAFALGSGEMSRFNRRLRDRLGVVSAVDASVFTPSFPGLLTVSALVASSSLTAAVAALVKEMVALRVREPVTDEELERARANLKFERQYRDESVEGRARVQGFGLTTPQKILFDETYAGYINKLTSDLIQSAISRWLDLRQAVVVALVPADSALRDEDLRQAYREGLVDEPATQKPRSRAAAAPPPATEVLPIKDGIKLVYRRKPGGGLLSLTAATEGGLRNESAQSAGLHSACAGLLGSASEMHGYEELMRIVESRGASLTGFSGKDSLGLSLTCLPEDLDRMLELFAECLMQPVFPTEQWQVVSREMLDQIAAQDDSPASVCVRRFQEEVFGPHPYRYPLYGTVEAVRAMDEEQLRAFFISYRDGGPWVFAAEGPMTSDTIVSRLRGCLGEFNPGVVRRRFSSEDLVGGGGRRGRHEISKVREQSHILYGFPGLTWGDAERAALDMVVNLLGGHGGRLFQRLRDRDSLAYQVTPLILYGCHPGAVGSYIACTAAKASRALTALKHEMQAIVEVPPAEEEVLRARHYIVGSHEMSLQHSDAQTMTMALMELYGYGFDDFLTYPGKVRAVTRLDMQRVAARLFIKEAATEVIVGLE